MSVHSPDILLHQLFEAQASRSPAAVALSYEGQALRYGELDDRAQTLAVHLKAVGVGPDVLVGLCVERSLEMVVGLLGILKAGGAYVPIDPAYPPARIASMLGDTQLGVLVTQRALLDKLPPTPATRVLLDEPLPFLGPPTTARPAVACTGENLAYVIYTSGSTGAPLGVQIEHRAVVNFIGSMRREPGLSAHDVVLALTTLSFDIALLEIFLPLSTGARCVIVPWQKAVEGSALARIIKEQGITFMQATPATWRLLLTAGWSGTPGLKVLCGGEPLPPELARELLPRCRELWNMYGPTETTVWSTCCRVRDAGEITIGHAIDNTTVAIVDDALRPVPSGQVGELLIGGQGLARGYFQRPELTAQKFIADEATPGGRAFRTGDLARALPTGEIQCLGRLDSQAKLNGFRIDLGEVESVLCRHPEVQQAVVIVREDVPGDKRLVCYLTTRNAAACSLSGVRAHARAQLPRHMVPAAFVVLDTLPLTPSRKLDRRQLPAPTAAHFAPDRRSEPPANAVEARIAAVWERLLHLPVVGRNDNFFDLGGTSLLAAAMLVELKKTVHHAFTLAVLFEAPTPAALARLLSGAGSSPVPGKSLVPIQPNGHKPAFFCVHGAGGNVLLYRELAARLGPSYPFHGLQSRGLDGKSRPLTTIPEMAAAYLEEIRRFQPQGPYCLGGYCLGGSIALEMASLLHQQGEDVALVALLDTYNFAEAVPVSRVLDLAERVKFHLGSFMLLRPAQMKGYLAEKIRVARDGELATLLGSATARKRVSEDARTAGHTALRNIQAINNHAADTHRPEPFPGKITVFKPRTNYAAYPDPLMGWGKIARAGVDIVELPVNPHAMLVEPFVRHLAATLAMRIDEVENAHPQHGGSYKETTRIKTGRSRR